MDGAMIVLVEVGCLECSIPSRMIGVFGGEAEALAAMELSDEQELRERQEEYPEARQHWGPWEAPPIHEMRWGGQTAQIMFDLDPPHDLVKVRFW